MDNYKDIEDIGGVISRFCLLSLASSVFHDELLEADGKGSLLGVPLSLLPSLSGICVFLSFLLCFKFIILLIELKCRVAQEDIEELLDDMEKTSVKGEGGDEMVVTPSASLDISQDLKDAYVRAQNLQDRYIQNRILARKILESIIFIFPLFIFLFTLIVSWRDFIGFISRLWESFSTIFGYICSGAL